MKWVVNCRQEEYQVLVARPSKYGNPYSHKYGTLAKFKVETRDEDNLKYESWLQDQPALIAVVCRGLRCKVLGCYCDPLPCHGEVLSRIANNSQLCLPIPDEVI